MEATFVKRSITAVAALALASGCSSAPGNPGAAADTITRAVIANDYDSTVSNFDDSTKKTISRSDLGSLSDRMNALGEYRALNQRSSDPDRGRYEYDATFSRGALLVMLRVDPDGKIGAYRVQSEATRAADQAPSNG